MKDIDWVDWADELKWILVYLINIVAFVVGFYLGRTTGLLAG